MGASVCCWVPGSAQDTAEMEFTECATQAGIHFVHTDGASGRHYVIEPFTAGLAIFDYDGDGYQDLYFLNGAPLPGTESDFPPTNTLYRNNGDWTFREVTLSAGVGHTGYALGVVASDFDNDGDADLYVSNYGPNVLYINNGDGTFTDVTRRAGVEDGERFGAGVLFLDIDNDGDLDLYCANYQKFTFDQHIVRKIGEHQFHPGPADYPPEYDTLFRNNGDGTFTDISESSGIRSVAGTGMGTIAGDFDRDGDVDLVVVNDSRPNFYFVNQGDGHFTEEGVLVGLAYDRTGRANGNMGIDSRDVDGDGRLDLVTTTYEEEMPVLYQNLGDGFFNDSTNLARLDTSLTPHVNWGVGFEDFDNDADVDLYIACGHFKDNIRFISDRTQMKVRNYLLQNNGRGVFETVPATGGSGLDAVTCSRGAAFADLDNDGDQDIVVLNFNDRPSLLRNELPDGTHWLDVRLVGRASNRDGVGARITLQAGQRTLVAMVHAGRGYQSHYGTRVHFGLPAEISKVDLTVDWPSGQTTQKRLKEWNQVVVVQESGGESPELGTKH